MSRRKKKKDAPFGYMLAAMMAAGLVLLVAGALRTLGVEMREEGMATMAGMWSQLALLYTGVCAAVWCMLKFGGWRGDEGFAGGVFMLLATGLLLQGRLHVFDNGVWSTMSGISVAVGGAGFAVAALALRGDRLKNAAWLGWGCYAAAIAVLLAMLVFGKPYRGGIYLPGRINPTEIIKPLLVVFAAMFLQARGKAFALTQLGVPAPPLRDLAVLAGLWMVPLALVFGLKDLGLLMLLNAVLVVMLYAASGRFRYLPLGVLAGTAACAALGMVARNVAERLAMWRDPFADVTGKGWQVLHSLTAFFAGGVFGSGLGEGMPEAVPIVSSDFVYAAVAEELGLLGCVLLVLVYFAWFLRGWRIATASNNAFAMLLAAGLTASLAVQALFNIAGVSKALPMTGITLPFLSQGGNSLIAVMLTAGIIAAVSDAKKSGKRKTGNAPKPVRRKKETSPPENMGP